MMIGCSSEVKPDYVLFAQLSGDLVDFFSLDPLRKYLLPTQWAALRRAVLLFPKLLHSSGSSVHFSMHGNRTVAGHVAGTATRWQAR